MNIGLLTLMRFFRHETNYCHMVKSRPDLFYAYVGTGQSVNQGKFRAAAYAQLINEARIRLFIFYDPLSFLPEGTEDQPFEAIGPFLKLFR